jgi:single-strand DNA-binding protein
MSFNKITIVGFLGRDPELKTTPQGTAVCKFSVATTERRKGITGESEEVTSWFRVTVWGRQAELANEYLSKGRQVYVEGRLRVEEYIDRDGNTRFSLEVNATDLQFLGQRGGEMPMQAPAQEPVVAEPKVIAKKAPAYSGTSFPTRISRKVTPRKTNAELVSIEEDGVPF